MIINPTFGQMIDCPVRKFEGKVDIYQDSTLSKSCNSDDALKKFTIERTGEENKFFGYGICARLSTTLIDSNREIEVSTANHLKACFGVGGEYINTFPKFKVDSVRVDELTNELSIVAYDALYQATEHTTAEIELSEYTIEQFAQACAALLGLTLKIENVADAAFGTYYPTVANFEGTETIREALNAIAEATQTIYFVNYNDELVFKRPDMSGEAVAVIDKEKYFKLSSGANRRLAKLISATSLGDNLSVEATFTGSTQVIMDNPFWDLREDRAALLENALNAVSGLTINQFSMEEFRGNFLLEPVDKIAIVNNKNETVFSYVLNDVINYDGALSAQMEWKYSNTDDEDASQPTTIGEAMKKTYATVNKVEKQIDMVVSETEANAAAISSLQMTTNSINASVQDVRKTVAESVDGMNSEITELTKKVNAQITPEQVQLQINNSLDNGVHKVETTTGFTFNDEGLRVSKSGSEMSTLITEDGMQVYRDSTAVLTANNLGVDAVNLHATTYLIIGNNSRLEDWEGRTACFWIGG